MQFKISLFVQMPGPPFPFGSNSGPREKAAVKCKTLESTNQPYSTPRFARTYTHAHNWLHLWTAVSSLLGLIGTACAHACRFWPNHGVEYGWFVLSTVLLSNARGLTGGDVEVSNWTIHKLETVMQFLIYFADIYSVLSTNVVTCCALNEAPEFTATVIGLIMFSSSDSLSWFVAYVFTLFAGLETML